MSEQYSTPVLSWLTNFCKRCEQFRELTEYNLIHKISSVKNGKAVILKQIIEELNSLPGNLKEANRQY